MITFFASPTGAAFTLGVLGFLLSLGLTPLCRDAFRTLGILDYPDELRKVHTTPVPRAGGIAIALSYGVACLAGYVYFRPAALFPPSLPIAMGALIVLTAGLVDDVRGLSAKWKLAMSLVAGVVAWTGGVRVSGIGGFAMQDWVSLLITVAWLACCTNAFNLIDGLDGLSTGLGLFATVTMVVAGLLQHNTALVILTLPLAGCLVAFLRYNFSPASVFLGDSGSLLIGFLLGCYGAVWSQKSATLIGMIAPLLALAVPLMDTGMAILRRSRHHRHIFTADREHLHHQLLDLGFTHQGAVLLLYAVCVLAAFLSLLHTMYDQSQVTGAIILVFCTASWWGVRRLRRRGARA